MIVSVLMSTYRKEKPEYLRQSLRSIWTDQLRKPDQIVLIEDGPLTPKLYQVIDEWKEELGDILTIVKNEKNMGLAIALNNGLEQAKGDIIVRMDSDDIAYPERIKEELYVLEKDPSIDVVGSWLSEFFETTDNTISVRTVPKLSEDIYEFGKFRNPMNHPTVAFRKKCVVENEGYKHFRWFEDYCLWSRMLIAGYKFYNIQKSLLWFRTSHELYKRRGGIRYAIIEIRFQFFLYHIEYISFFEMLRNITIRFIGRIIPNFLRKTAYRKAFR